MCTWNTSYVNPSSSSCSTHHTPSLLLSSRESISPGGLSSSGLQSSGRNIEWFQTRATSISDYYFECSFRTSTVPTHTTETARSTFHKNNMIMATIGFSVSFPRLLDHVVNLLHCAEDVYYSNRSTTLQYTSKAIQQIPPQNIDQEIDTNKTTLHFPESPVAIGVHCSQNDLRQGAIESEAQTQQTGKGLDPIQNVHVACPKPDIHHNSLRSSVLTKTSARLVMLQCNYSVHCACNSHCEQGSTLAMVSTRPLWCIAASLQPQLCNQ